MNPLTVDGLMHLARNAAAAWHRDESMDNPRVLKFDAAEATLRAAIESALADAYDTGMRKGAVWGLAKVQPKPEPVGWLDAPYAVFRANPNWQWQKGPTTLSASIPVWLHPTPEADERERCAAICESIAHQYKRNGHGFAAERSANAIRAQQP